MSEEKNENQNEASNKAQSSENKQEQPISGKEQENLAQGSEKEQPDLQSMAPPPVDFRLFIEGFVGQALVALGKIPHPVTGETSVELPWARYFIDILGMLEEKTQGNLDKELASLLESRLTMLRMTFVDMQK